MPFDFERGERPIQRLTGHANFRRDVLKLTLDRDAATVRAGTQPQILQDAISCGANVAQLHPCPKFLKLMGEAGHESCCEHRVGSERLHHLRLRVNPNSRRRGRDGIAVVGFREQRGLRKELASARGMEDHKVIIDGASDEPKATAFDLVYRGGLVALFEQHLARSKLANNAPGLKRGASGDVIGPLQSGGVKP